jgi:hypothetical protein
LIDHEHGLVKTIQTHPLGQIFPSSNFASLAEWSYPGKKLEAGKAQILHNPQGIRAAMCKRRSTNDILLGLGKAAYLR